MNGGIRTAWTDALLGESARRASRGLHRLGRAIRGSRRTVRYFHRVDDPRSWLLATVLGPFVDAYDLDLVIEVVPAPAAEVDPEPELRARFDVDDTRRFAQKLGLLYPEPAFEPVAARVRMANALAIVPRPPREHLDRLVAISALLLARDGDALARLADEEGTTRGQDLRPALEAAYVHLRKAGHYLGATLEYEGEFYEGVERLNHLERRLVDEGLESRGFAPRFEPVAARADAKLIEVEVFFSYRSPFSYLGLARIAAYAPSFGLRLVLRPMLPMVMRGLPIPPDKRRYTILDAKREADVHGIPFGKFATVDDVGVERCLAVHALAEREGKALEFALAATSGIWSRGVDPATDAGLVEIAERAGLDKDAALAATADESYRARVEENRDALYEAGLWGVPAFRVGTLATWGQDRLPFVLAEAERLRG